MNRYEKEILAKSAVKEIPGYAEFTEDQQKALAKWYSDEIEYHEKKCDEAVSREDSKKFVGLIPIAVIIGLKYAKWEFNPSALVSIIAAYILCGILFFVFGHAYGFFVIQKSNSTLGTILFVIITCIISAMVGMQFFDVR